MTISHDESQWLKAIRVPLIIMVIFIHENPTPERVGLAGMMFDKLTKIAVPCFFLMSGFFFIGDKGMTAECYKRKIRTRVNTLFIPYVIWNILPILIPIACSFATAVVRHDFTVFRAFTSDFLGDIWHDGVWHVFWDRVSDELPMNFSLWYVRDLMIVCIISPVLYFLVKRCGKVFIVTLIAVFVLGGGKYFPLGLSLTSILFFSCGMYLAMNEGSIIRPLSRLGLYPAALALLLLIAATLVKTEHSNVIHSSYIVCGVVSAFIIISRMRPGVTKMLASLSGTVFFVYAIHAIFVLQRTGSLLNRLMPGTPAGQLALYFITPFATFFVCLAIYWLMRRWMPGVLGVLCGNRK